MVSSTEIDTFPRLMEKITDDLDMGKWVSLSDSIMEFNSNVWRQKKDLGISLNSEISNISIPDEISLLADSLVRMHKLI